MGLSIVEGRIEYRCGKCGAEGCKLWREYNTFLSHQELYCVNCACADQAGKYCKFGPEDVDSSGKAPSSFYGHLGERTDQIGNLIPAVPTADEDTFWGYTSVPYALVRWWRELPTHPELVEGAA